MILKAVKADILHANAIASIGRRSFTEAFSHLFEDKNDLREYLDYTYNPSKIEKSLRKRTNVFYIAFVNGEPAGFAKVKTFSLNDMIESVSQMELQKIYVLKKHHGTGAAEALIQSVFALAQKNQPDFLWLDVQVDNKRAIRFYEKNSFEKTGIHYFNIGSQTFEYYIMSIPIAAEAVNNAKELCESH